MTRPLSAPHSRGSHSSLRPSPRDLAVAAAAALPAPRRRLLTAQQLFWAAAAVFLMSFVSPSKAEAAEPAFQSQLIETGSVYAPRGFSELCERRPEFCAAERAAQDTDPAAEALSTMFGRGAARFQPPALTKASLDALRRVNAAVNATIRPVADRGADHWELNAKQGDCEEYVLMKRELLARLGWPRSALRITVVRDSQRYHAILVAETDRGGYVLDNMVGHITTVKDSPYEFVVSQSVDTPGAWVRVKKR